MDLGCKKTVTRIKTLHWGGGFAPTKIVIYISEDSDKWKFMDNLKTSSGGRQNTAFFLKKHQFRN